MGRFGLSYEQTKTLTLYEFALYSLAHQVKKQGEQLNASYQAWQNQAVQATKGSGKNIQSAYNSFQDFYDPEKEFKDIFVPNSNKKRKLSMAEMNRRINEGGG